MGVLKGIGAVIGVIVLVVILYAALFGVSVVGIRLGGMLNQEQQNANRQANQQSQAYVETKQEEMLSFWRQYNDPNATDGQKAAISASICDDSILIKPGDWPQAMVTFIDATCH